MNQHIGTATKLFGMLMLTGMVGCSAFGSLMDADRIDYKSATDSKSSVSKLEVPPDLTQLQRDSRYSIPEAASGTITASGYSSQQGAKPAAGAVVVAPREMPNVRIERAGSQRWLVVNKAPQALWPQIKDFWQESGFLINVDSPETGVMETDWAENRAKIPQDFIRRTLGRVLESLYSTGERDKFRTRLERAADGSTEIYISHRGAQEELVGVNKDSTVWTMRPSDPELEAEFLSRMMVRLGAAQERAKVAVSNAVPQQAQARLIKGASGSLIEADEGFDRLWRRVGLALDRVGFTVEDRDRSQGLYFVRYVDQDRESQNKAAAEKGFFSRMFSSKDDKDKTAQRYRVSVKAIGAKSQVTVLGNDGQPENSPIADKILSLLHAQLK